MAAIKNVGTGAVNEILRARVVDGTFTSLEDFLSKVNVRVVNRKALESLIKSGAFDRFGDRGLLLGNLEVMMAYANRVQKQVASGQTDLFGEGTESSIEARPKLAFKETEVVHMPREQLAWERELLGLYLSQHPLESFRVFLEEQTVPLDQLKAEHDNKSVNVGGTVLDVREINTKNGQKMAFIKIADLSGEIELILFPNAYQQTTGLWERDRVVLARGKVSGRGRDGNISQEVKILVNDAREVTHEQAVAFQGTGKKLRVPSVKKIKAASISSPTLAAPATKSQRLYIRLEDGSDQSVLMSLKQTIESYGGDTDVVLILGPNNDKQVIKLPMKIEQTEASITSLKQLVGDHNVKIS